MVVAIVDANAASIAVAFGAGLVSFLSPCVLPLIPTYVAYLAGGSLQGVDSAPTAALKRRVMINAVGFIAGFSVVFVLLGLSASAIGRFLLYNQALLRQVSGVVVIVFGLSMMGVFRFSFLQREKRFQLRGRHAGPFGSALLGMAFSAGWTPCIGPILTSILILASNSASVLQGAGLLAVYSAGLGVPFLLTAASLGWFLKFSRRIRPYLGRVEFVSGVLLVVVGILLFTNSFARLSALGTIFG